MNTQITGTLEPPYGHIVMMATSQVEREKRLTAVSKERESVSFIEAMAPGSVFLDIGANTGAYSLIAASRKIHTYAIEPHGPTYQHLCMNIELNQLNGYITPYLFALSDRNGKIGLEHSSEEPGSALHINHPSGKGIPTEAYRLDSLIHMGLLRQPDYIKSDCDDADARVLAGATETLRSVQAIQVELNDSNPDDVAQITHACEKAGLHMFMQTRHGQTPISNALWVR